MTIFDVEKLPWAPSRGQASGVQSHLLLKTLKIRPRIQMLKIPLSEAWYLSQSEAARPPQPADATRSSVKECASQCPGTCAAAASVSAPSYPAAGAGSRP